MMRHMVRARFAALAVLFACVLSGGYLSSLRDLRAQGARGRSVRAGRLDVERGQDHLCGRYAQHGESGTPGAGLGPRLLVSPHPPGTAAEPFLLLAFSSVLPLSSFSLLPSLEFSGWRISSYETLRLPVDHPFSWAKRPPPAL
jgi:hypothetical protein